MMQKRPYGKTGLQVSAIGLGCGMLGSPNTDYAVRLVRRARELGVTYFDAARGYRDAETILGLALEGERDQVVISTKTNARTRDDAWANLETSLRELRTDYLDNYHLHGVDKLDDLSTRLGPGGALQAAIEAREQGLVHHIGITGHRAATLVEALLRWPFEVILVPMNVAERTPLERLIPLCVERGVAVTTMKPLATGLLPAPVALKWLLSQPIASCVPGATTIEEATESALVGHAAGPLSADESAQVEALNRDLAQRRCRICGDCLPCPAEINIPMVLGTDIMYDHYRNMGRESFRAFEWSHKAIEGDLPNRRRVVAAIEACTQCGACDERCPFGLPVQQMLQAALPAHRDIVTLHEEYLARG